VVLEYALTLWIQGEKTPAINANGYPSKEACITAGELMKAADMAAKKSKHNYIIICRGITPQHAPDALKHQG